jgi:ubiquinone/menaquinone biosynthesis C-methylase UbiE
LSGNEKQIRAMYEDPAAEKQRFSASRSAGMEAHYTKKLLDPYIARDTRVLEVGCATGYYALHYADTCREYVGVDLVPEHVALLRRRAEEKGFSNVKAKVGDATALQEADGRYDVVCCLGPLYHLPSAERKQAMRECARVCRPGGTLAFAYINRVGVYAGACVHGRLREFYPSQRANACVLGQGVDDMRPEVFFYTMPEEMEDMAMGLGLIKLRNLGTDFFFAADAIDRMDDEKFALYQPLADEMARYENCTGLSNHALLLCRKPAAE